MIIDFTKEFAKDKGVELGCSLVIGSTQWIMGEATNKHLEMYYK